MYNIDYWKKKTLHSPSFLKDIFTRFSYSVKVYIYRLSGRHRTHACSLLIPPLSAHRGVRQKLDLSPQNRPIRPALYSRARIFPSPSPPHYFFFRDLEQDACFRQRIQPPTPSNTYLGREREYTVVISVSKIFDFIM
jgi:hypothetical protein